MHTLEPNLGPDFNKVAPNSVQNASAVFLVNVGANNYYN